MRESLKVLLVANHEAAGGRAARLLPRLRDFLHARLPALEYERTGDLSNVRKLAAEAAGLRYHRVVAAGGDGTAHAVLNALRGSHTALGLLPLGHGNDLARALGIPLHPLAAAEFLLHAPVAAIDLACVGSEAYACVAGVGFDAETNRRANGWGPRPTGHARYFLAALRTLASYRPLRVELVSDTEGFAGEVMWVSVANTPTYGGGLRIAPGAAVDDGALDVCLVERISPLALLKLYPALLRGTHRQAACVRYFRATRLMLRAPAGAELFADGEFLARLPVEIRVEPAAVQVLRRPN